MSTWTPMTERRPTEADLPILLWNAGVPKAKYTATAEALRSQMQLTCFSHWMKAPEPPARELTQREKDEARFTSFFLNEASTKLLNSAVRHEAWHAALAYRDAENRKDLEGGTWFSWEPGCGNVPRIMIGKEALNRLKQRAGIQP
jgi:hypothetical protein